MPGSIMHLYCANEFLKREKISSPELFLAGAIAPDAVNDAMKLAPREVRWAAHLRHADLDEWELSAIAFYHKNMLKYGDFALGYFFHILTDIMWDRKYNDELKNHFIMQGDPDGNLPKRKELRDFGEHLSTLPWWGGVREALIKVRPPEINGISPERQKEQLERLTRVRRKRNITTEFLTDEIMNTFSEQLVAHTIGLLSAIR